jgi:hypothetical protein
MASQYLESCLFTRARAAANLMRRSRNLSRSVGKSVSAISNSAYGSKRISPIQIPFRPPRLATAFFVNVALSGCAAPSLRVGRVCRLRQRKKGMRERVSTRPDLASTWTHHVDLIVGRRAGGCLLVHSGNDGRRAVAAGRSRLATCDGLVAWSLLLRVLLARHLESGISTARARRREASSSERVSKVTVCLK